MRETGLAAAANSGHLGLKGIIAGNVIVAFVSLPYYILFASLVFNPVLLRAKERKRERERDCPWPIMNL